MLANNAFSFFKFFIKIFLSLSSIVIYHSFCFGQNVDTTAATNVTTDSARKKTTITLAAIYSNNANFYGQTADEPLPYLALSGTIRLPAGIYLSALGYRLLGDSSFVSASALSLGYGFHITPKLSADASYTHTFYPAGSPFLQASSPGIASAALQYDYAITTAVTVDYTFGEEQDYYLTLANSKNFDIQLSGGTAILSITPQVDVIAGTQKFYETYLIEKKNKGKGKAPPGQTKTVTTSYNQFGFISYNCNLPISYSRSHYMIEAAYQLSVLGNNAVTGAGKANSFLTLSAYYQF